MWETAVEVVQWIAARDHAVAWGAGAIAECAADAVFLEWACGEYVVADIWV